MQTREALLTVLKDLNADDYFALIQFDNSIGTWKESLTKATKKNVSEAMTYVKKIRENGGKSLMTLTFMPNYQVNSFAVL